MLVMTYTNRKRKAYYLFEGKTKTGKSRYFFSLKQDAKGEFLDKIPEGYEVYEHPVNAQVFLRKKTPRQITELEEHFVKKELKNLPTSKRYLVDCKDACLTIYESNTDLDKLSSTLDYAPLRPGLSKEQALDNLVAISEYTAVLRFCLVDAEKRIFSAERFCFRGSIDDWIPMFGADNDFRILVKNALKNLGTGDFFSSIY